MSQMTNYLENKLIDHLFRSATFAKPTVLAVGLFTSAPDDAGTGTEVAGNNYARATLNPDDANWDATQGGNTGASSGTTGLTANSAAITFPIPSAGWGTITHFAVFDAATGGNMLLHGALAIPKTINSGDAISFLAGQLQVTAA